MIPDAVMLIRLIKVFGKIVYPRIGCKIANEPDCIQSFGPAALVTRFSVFFPEQALLCS